MNDTTPTKTSEAPAGSGAAGSGATETGATGTQATGTGTTETGATGRAPNGETSALAGTDVRIRVARPDEAAALADLAAATFPLACPPHTSADAIAAFLRDVLATANFEAFLADPNRMLLVAEDRSGLLIGYTMLVFGEPHDADAAGAIRIRPSAELSKCYLRAEAHGSGAAAALMTATLDAARERGAAGSWLGVNQENVRALRFYGKHGFERVGIKRFLVGGRYEDDFVLERAL